MPEGAHRYALQLGKQVLNLVDIQKVVPLCLSQDEDARCAISLKKASCFSSRHQECSTTMASLVSLRMLTNATEADGLIGLGSMGYPMCSNLHSKISTDSGLYICDVNKSVLQRFRAETHGIASVIVLDTPKEVAERSVSSTELQGCLEIQI